MVYIGLTVALFSIGIAIADGNLDLLDRDRLTCELLKTESVKRVCLLAIEAETNMQETSVPGSEEIEISEELGIEHLQRNAPKNKGLSEQTLESKVLEVLENRRGLKTFVLENGQIWKQNEADYIQIPKRGEFSVLISKGRFGDYQLRVAGIGRMTRVKRQR